MEYKVSVIVPVYNVQDYLRECLDSLANQTLENIEVLMINDGSPDESPKIIDEYADRFPNFKAFHKENGGLGHTRNFGIKHAQGEYIAFVDSDDYIPFDALEKMYNYAKYYDADVVVGKAIRFKSNEDILYDPSNGLYECVDYVTNIYSSPELFHNGIVANKLHRKKNILENNIFFPEKILYEDTFFAVKEYIESNKIVVIPDICYYWRIREDKNNLSISQTNNTLSNFMDRLRINKMCDEIVYQSNVPLHVQEEWDFFKCRNLLTSYGLMASKLPPSEKNVFLKLIKSELEKFKESTLLKLPDHLKLRMHALINNYTEEIIDINNSIKKKKFDGLNIINIGNEKLIVTPCEFGEKNYLIEDIFDITDQSPLIKGIDSLKIDSENIEVNGYAFIKYFDYNLRNQVDFQAIVTINDDTKIPVNTQLVEREDLSFIFDGCYKLTGFKIQINIADLFEKISVYQSPDVVVCKLNLNISVGKINKEIRIGNPVDILRKRYRSAHTFNNKKYLLELYFNKKNNLSLKITRSSNVKRGIRMIRSYFVQ